MFERTAAAIDHDCCIFRQLIELLPQLIQVAAVPGWPNVNRPFYNGSRPDAKNDRLFCLWIQDSLCQVCR